ncbi:cell division protein FtsQ/DivIB [Calothrix sp. PCC 6303]|uniref:cell division protein FtsQ/DivIB n=1 Tax=Calothrix sp. PCC 6303 TaxID=1170562 RepID=UPI0002A04D25|nr:FtsQ-type POTRA domain-containing protein [Calothrix sp. PCC 6303]AFZ02718.1 Polypeptide-transport-associated domain protein FtsQ-type [Calothrix sp. PCC 6303]
MVTVSRIDLAQRRRKLRRQRRVRIIQLIWQTFAVGSLASGLWWLAIQPMWVLKNYQDIEVEGNQLLSSEAVQLQTGLVYPRSLWRIQPSAITKSLKHQPIIADAVVSRRLFPPGLVIQIQEKVPVAIAFDNDPNTSLNPTEAKKIKKGLLDADGTWIPIDKYITMNPNAKMPTLKVIGSPQQYASFWSSFYRAVSQSQVLITEIDYQDSSNLILKTELGLVHLGAPTPRLEEQIKILAKMRHLPNKVNPNKMEYIDLKNPDSPLVQMNQKIPKKNLNSQK